jgi:hypothetical protein
LKGELFSFSRLHVSASQSSHHQAACINKQYLRTITSVEQIFADGIPLRPNSKSYKIDCMASRFLRHFFEYTTATQQILLILYKHPT